MTEQRNNKALVIVDEEACFFPASEGERLGLEGYGELGVDGAEKVIEPTNKLTGAYRHQFLPIAYTLDQHPEDTGHFSDEPNFVNTWPKHGRAGTPGGELHPDLLIAKHLSIGTRFIKGDIVAEGPEDDTSYTGVLAHTKDGLFLPDYLREKGVEEVTVVGIALGEIGMHLCVDSTAYGLKDEGFDVTVATDAVAPLWPEKAEAELQAMGEYGMHLLTTQEIIDELNEIYG